MKNRGDLEQETLSPATQVPQKGESLHKSLIIFFAEHTSLIKYDLS